MDAKRPSLKSHINVSHPQDNLIMIKHVFAVLFAVMTVSACNSETTSPPQSSATTGTPVSGGATASVKSQAAAILMGDYTPTFAHRVRSQRHEALPNGKFQHVVIVEYMDITDEVVGKALSEDLVARGLNVRGPMAHNGAARYLAQNSKVGQMFADLNTEPAIELSPGAHGIIYFSWRDAQAR